MFKKFIGHTLLSIAVDKKARNKIKALYQKKVLAKEQDVEPTSSPRQGVSSKPPEPVNAENSQSTPHDVPLPRIKRFDDPKSLAKYILTTNKNKLEQISNTTGDKTSITRERLALIERAMEIRRSKLYVLNELDPDQLEKLATMAIKALNLRIQK